MEPDNQPEREQNRNVASNEDTMQSVSTPRRKIYSSITDILPIFDINNLPDISYPRLLRNMPPTSPQIAPLSLQSPNTLELARLWAQQTSPIFERSPLRHILPHPQETSNVMRQSPLTRLLNPAGLFQNNLMVTTMEQNLFPQITIPPTLSEHAYRVIAANSPLRNILSRGTSPLHFSSSSRPASPSPNLVSSLLIQSPSSFLREIQQSSTVMHSTPRQSPTLAITSPLIHIPTMSSRLTHSFDSTSRSSVLTSDFLENFSETSTIPAARDIPTDETAGSPMEILSQSNDTPPPLEPMPQQNENLQVLEIVDIAESPEIIVDDTSSPPSLESITPPLDSILSPFEITSSSSNSPSPQTLESPGPMTTVTSSKPQGSTSTSSIKRKASPNSQMEPSNKLQYSGSKDSAQPGPTGWTPSQILVSRPTGNLQDDSQTPSQQSSSSRQPTLLVSCYQGKLIVRPLPKRVPPEQFIKTLSRFATSLTLKETPSSTAKATQTSQAHHSSSSNVRQSVIHSASQTHYSSSPYVRQLAIGSSHSIPTSQTSLQTTGIVTHYPPGQTSASNYGMLSHIVTSEPQPSTSGYIKPISEIPQILSPDLSDIDIDDEEVKREEQLKLFIERYRLPKDEEPGEQEPNLVKSDEQQSSPGTSKGAISRTDREATIMLDAETDESYTSYGIGSDSRHRGRFRRQRLNDSPGARPRDPRKVKQYGKSHKQINLEILDFARTAPPSNTSRGLIWTGFSNYGMSTATTTGEQERHLGPARNDLNLPVLELNQPSTSGYNLQTSQTQEEYFGSSYSLPTAAISQITAEHSHDSRQGESEQNFHRSDLQQPSISGYSLSRVPKSSTDLQQTVAIDYSLSTAAKPQIRTGHFYGIKPEERKQNFSGSDMQQPTSTSTGVIWTGVSDSLSTATTSRGPAENELNLFRTDPQQAGSSDYSLFSGVIPQIRVEHSYGIRSEEREQNLHMLDQQQPSTSGYSLSTARSSRIFTGHEESGANRYRPSTSYYGMPSHTVTSDSPEHAIQAVPSSNRLSLPLLPRRVSPQEYCPPPTTAVHLQQSASFSTVQCLPPQLMDVAGEVSTSSGDLSIFLEPRGDRISDFQFMILEREYETCPYLTECRKMDISQRIGLTGQQIAHWFSRRRVKDRNMGIARSPSDSHLRCDCPRHRFDNRGNRTKRR